MQTIVGRIHGVSTAPPKGIISAKYTSGALLGNGDIGVVVGDTATDRQRFWFGKSDFWGTHWNAKHHAPEASILSLGSLTLSSPDPSPDSASAYRVDQDILQAEVRSDLKLGDAFVHLRSWTADGENLFLTEITCDSKSPAPARLVLTLAMPPEDDSPHTIYPSAVGLAGGMLWATRENNSTGGSDYHAKAAIVVRAVGAPIAPGISSASSAEETLTLKPGSHAWIAVSFKSDARIGDAGPSPRDLRYAALRAARSATAARIAQLENLHRNWWKQFWLRSYVDVHDPVLENYYYGALYVIGSSSRPGHLAPSLWGNFITTDAAAWGGRYFMNYNEEAAYYGVFSSNHADLAIPYNQMVLAQFPFQKNRTARAGYNGVSFQRTFTPFTTIATPPPAIPVAPEKNYTKLPSDQKSNATFSLLPAIQYYEYTQDRHFLREKLYPAMKQLDAFWRDFAVRDPATGKWAFEHSSAHEGGDDVNPNLDLGFARRVETELIDSSKLLGVDAGMRPVWRRFLDNLSPYPTLQVNGKTVYAIAASINNKIKDQGLFEPGDQPINLEGLVFPGENLSIGGDATQLQIARRSMQEMNSWGVTHGGNSNNGFCKIFPIAARIGWPADDLLNKFKAAILYHWRPSNLTVFQGGGGIETSGSVEALDSMLLQHEDGVMRVFPDWPKSRDASFVRLRAKGAFLVSSEQTANKVQWIDIVSEKGGPLLLQSPWTGQMPHCTGCMRKLTQSPDGRIEIETKPGLHYRLSPE
ncbi:MAG: glycosyl hydrolase family 95 catalytic domain-containing protein [Acidobacteriota bacterium]